MAGEGKRKVRRRGPRGRGTVFYDEARKRWIGRAPIGRTPDGRTRYVERWGRTQAEVVAKLAAARPPGPDTTVGVWARRWLAAAPVKESTRGSYGKTVAHVERLLGEIRVRDLTPDRIEAFVARLKDEGLNPNTVRKVLAELHNMLAVAVRDEVIPTNPVKVVRRPKKRKTEINPFTPAELAAIVAACVSQADWPIALLAATGCRSGEAAGLDVADFDPLAGTIGIRQTYDVRHGLRTPKSERSLRTIRVPAPALPAARAAATGRTGGPLFVSAAGRRRERELITLAWQRVLRRAGLAYRNLHQLRHSVATALISAGEPLGDVAGYLGDTVQTVVDTYLHPAGTDPADALERLLGGDKVGKGSPVVANPLKGRAAAG